MDAPPRPVAGLPGRLLEELDGLAAPLRNAGLAVSVRLLHGYVPELIVGLARDEEADWIVMGTHGRTGLPHVVVPFVVRVATWPIQIAEHARLQLAISHVVGDAGDGFIEPFRGHRTGRDDGQAPVQRDDRRSTAGLLGVPGL